MRLGSSIAVSVLLSLVDVSVAFQSPMKSIQTTNGALSCSGNDYLSSLSGPSRGAAGMAETMTQPLQMPLPTVVNGHQDDINTDSKVITFSHAPKSFFDVHKLTPKGPRQNADVGQPHDATRKLAEDGAIRMGSWWCAQGGWPSPKLRTTTEVFYVFEGQGCLADTDGTRHFFGPGDTVILPKGWSGRWDVIEPIHKVWFVHDHPNIEETSNPIRAVITHYNAFAPHCLTPHGLRPDALHGCPVTTSRTIYDVGPTEVGCWTCSPGSFPVVQRSTTECFHVLEGVFFLTNADGTAQRCGPGDTVLLPKGWSGYWDVIEPVKKLWVVV